VAEFCFAPLRRSIMHAKFTDKISQMKKTRSPHPHSRVAQAACTVSAAALMLGVSSAATVGFNLQVDWTDAGSAGYTGKPVTATAFGIGTNGWENLNPLPTGYNGKNPGPYTTNEVIDATTSTGGLNPLPNGSLTVSWACTAANSSGFAGYGIPYGGPNPNPGNQEVYYGFLRDEANFYSHPVGGPIPYSVTLTGLRSVWTNTPYAIQLIASTDTANVITNAYIGNVTTNQQATYDVKSSSTGILGGLSTMSGPWTNDTISIWGAPALSYTNGYAIASTISGFIITDKPVISMSPNSLRAVGGDTFVLGSYAVGVPPLSYQWRRNGYPLTGGTSQTLTNLQPAATDSGAYDVVVTNLYGAATSSVANVTVDRIQFTPGSNFVVDSNPNGGEHDGQAWGATWLASSTDSANVTRTGVMSFSAAAKNQIVVPGQTNLDSGTGTVMFWMRSPGVSNPSGNPVALLDRAGPDGLMILQNPDGTIQVQPALASTYALPSPTALDSNWHHIAVSFDQLGATMNLYVDGAPVAGFPSMPLWHWQPGQELELGTSHTASYQSFNGQMAEVRFYNQVLSDSDIASVYSSGAVVNPSALRLRLSFQAPPTTGVSLQWQAADVLLQSADSVQGPYTDLPGTSSPYDAAAQTAKKFFRYRGHTPQVLVSNPFRM